MPNLKTNRRFALRAVSPVKSAVPRPNTKGDWYQSRLPPAHMAANELQLLPPANPTTATYNNLVKELNIYVQDPAAMYVVRLSLGPLKLKIPDDPGARCPLYPQYR